MTGRWVDNIQATRFAVDRNARRALEQALVLETPDVAKESALGIIDEDHALLAVCQINIVVAINGHAGRHLQPVLRATGDTKRALAGDIQDVHRRQFRIGDDEPLPGIGGDVSRRLQHFFPAVGESKQAANQTCH